MAGSTSLNWFKDDANHVVGHPDFQSDWMAVEEIECIEVLRDPMSVLYRSEASGGVINVITRKPGDRRCLRAMTEYLWAAGWRDTDDHRATVSAKAVARKPFDSERLTRGHSCPWEKTTANVSPSTRRPQIATPRRPPADQWRSHRLASKPQGLAPMFFNLKSSLRNAPTGSKFIAGKHPWSPAMTNDAFDRPRMDAERARLPCLRIGPVMTLTGLGRSTIYRLMADDQFSPPVRLTKRIVVWRRADLEQWFETRPVVTH